MAAGRISIRELARQQKPIYDPVLLTIKERWVLQERLGKGGYGVVYSALDKQSTKLVAVKIEVGYLELFTVASREVLKGEYEIMETINEGISKSKFIGFPRPIYFASSDFMRVMVMDLLGDTILHSFSRVYPKMADVYNVSIQLLTRLERMHDKGVLNLDLKPDNIYFGRDEEVDHVYLADFGLSERYLNKDGSHRMNTTRSYIVGTNSFSSLNVMGFSVPSRRDDIESLGYVLIFMYFKALPWNDMRRWHIRHHKRNPASICNLITQNPEWETEIVADSTTDMRNCGVEEIKSKYPLDKLCLGLPGMKEFLEHARGLGYEQKPNYSLLRHILGRKIGRA